MKLGDFWEELKHRRVVRVGIGYAAIGAILVQAADLIFVPLGDTQRALFMYRHVLQLFQAADPTFDEELERIRTRVAELEAL